MKKKCFNYSFIFMLFIFSFTALKGQDFPLSEPGKINGIYDTKVENSADISFLGDEYKRGNSGFLGDAEINEEEIIYGIGEETEESSTLKNGLIVIFISSLIYLAIAEYRRRKNS